MTTTQMLDRIRAILKNHNPDEFHGEPLFQQQALKDMRVALQMLVDSAPAHKKNCKANRCSCGSARQPRWLRRMVAEHGGEESP